MPRPTGAFRNGPRDRTVRRAGIRWASAPEPRAKAASSLHRESSLDLDRGDCHTPLCSDMISAMNRIRGWWRDFWRTPDPVFVDAGAAGEVIVARTRLGLTLLVLAIPILDHVRRPQAQEVWVGIWFAAVGAILAAGVLWFTRRRLYRPW